MEKYEKFWSRDYSVHYNEAILRAVHEGSGRFNLPVFFYTFDQGFSVSASTAALKSKLYRDLSKKYLKNQKEFNQYKKMLENSCRDYLRVTRPYAEADLSVLSNRQLAGILQDYYQVWQVFSKAVFWGFILSECQAKKVNEFITARSQKLGRSGELSKFIAFANKPAKKCSIFLLEEEVARFKRQNRPVPFEKLYAKYQWLPYGDLNATQWRLSHFEKYVRDLKSSSEKIITPSQFKKKLELTAAEEEMVGLNHQTAYIRDYRDEVRRRGVYNIHFVYRQAARRLKIRYRDFLYLTTPETIEFLLGKPVSRKEISRRKLPAALDWKNRRMVFLTGPKARRYFSLIAEKKRDLAKGIPACAGIASGVAKIVRLDKDIKKVKPGEIMVAVTTHPDYVPKMRIAKAIVTDEGGLTCHAAIVARELGVPCVVGTKNATHLFKDGDKVEVDAWQGTVRKIK